MGECDDKGTCSRLADDEHRYAVGEAGDQGHTRDRRHQAIGVVYHVVAGASSPAPLPLADHGHARAVDLARDHELVEAESQRLAEQSAVVQYDGRVVADRQSQIELRVRAARDAAGAGGKDHPSGAVLGREQLESAEVPRNQMRGRVQ